MSDDPLICVAACAGRFGVKGEVKVKSFTGEPENCFAYGPLRNEAGEVVLNVISHRPIKAGFAIRCQEVETPEQADELKSVKLYVYRSALPEPEEDEFYFEDLIGLEVKTTDGVVMGKVKAVHNFGAGDMLEIAGGTNQQGQPIAGFYHPFTLAGVPEVDVKSRRILIKIVKPDIAKEN